MFMYCGVSTMKSPKEREEYLIMDNRIKSMFPDNQIGKEVLLEINEMLKNKLYKAKDRATINRRTRWFTCDL